MNISTANDNMCEEKININEDNEDNYKFTTNINRKLLKILEVSDFTYDDNFVWDQPKENGLNNCDPIIPDYYKKTCDKILDIDYYELIKDDIKNYRKLNKYKIDYILTLSCEHKNELLIVFNDCLNNLAEILYNT